MKLIKCGFLAVLLVLVSANCSRSRVKRKGVTEFVDVVEKGGTPGEKKGVMNKAVLYHTTLKNSKVVRAFSAVLITKGKGKNIVATAYRSDALEKSRPSVEGQFLQGHFFGTAFSEDEKKTVEVSSHTLKTGAGTATYWMLRPRVLGAGSEEKEAATSKRQNKALLVYIFKQGELLDSVDEASLMPSNISDGKKMDPETIDKEEAYFLSYEFKVKLDASKLETPLDIFNAAVKIKEQNSKAKEK